MASDIELPSDSCYASVRIGRLMREYLAGRGIAVDEFADDLDLTLDELAATFVRSGSHDATTVLQMLREARAYAFETKYGRYDYTRDARRFIPGWAEEFRGLVSSVKAGGGLHGAIIVVGVGDGTEGELLIRYSTQITLVDISRVCLEVATHRLSGAVARQLSAENLHGVASCSQDLYVSLRTFQSRFFGVEAAIREAWRVLKPGGWAMISVSNAFVGSGNQLVPGHILPRTRRLDCRRPFLLRDRIGTALAAVGFTTITRSDGRSELYCAARKDDAESLDG